MSGLRNADYFDPEPTPDEPPAHASRCMLDPKHGYFRAPVCPWCTDDQQRVASGLAIEREVAKMPAPRGGKGRPRAVTNAVDGRRQPIAYGIEWEESPKKTVAARTGVVDDLLRQVAAKPGRWAKVCTVGSRGRASSRASWIRKRAADLKLEADVVSRGSSVYVRVEA